MGFGGSLTARLTLDASRTVVATKLIKGAGLPHYRDVCVLDKLKRMKLPAGTPRTLTHTFQWRSHLMESLARDVLEPPDGGS